MSTGKSRRDAHTPGESTVSYLSPTADFVLLFGVAAVVALVAAAVLLP